MRSALLCQTNGKYSTFLTKWPTSYALKAYKQGNSSIQVVNISSIQVVNISEHGGPI